MSKLTKEQLQGMSDFEVNAALADLSGLNVLHDVDPLHSKTAAVYHNGCSAEEYNGTNIDYCNTPNDIMPLAFEYGISMLDFGGETVAFSKFSHVDVTSYDLKQGLDLEIAADYVFISKNPLRAIACCLILVLQEKS